MAADSRVDTQAGRAHGSEARVCEKGVGREGGVARAAPGAKQCGGEPTATIQQLRHSNGAQRTFTQSDTEWRGTLQEPQQDCYVLAPNTRGEEGGWGCEESRRRVEGGRGGSGGEPTATFVQPGDGDGRHAAPEAQDHDALVLRAAAARHDGLGAAGHGAQLVD